MKDITVGDVLEYVHVETTTQVKAAAGSGDFYRALRQLGIFPAEAPERLSELRAAGQRSPAELIDRYHLASRSVRDVLVDYLRERQPALDYTSLDSLANMLGNRFWADIEAHHPGIDSLDLPRDIADAWKRRLQTRPKKIIAADGTKTVITVPRINYRECLTPVRAFYLVSPKRQRCNESRHTGNYRQNPMMIP